MNSVRLFILMFLSVTGLLVMGCSAEKVQPNYKKLSNPSDIQPATTDYSLSPVELLPPSSCSYLEQLHERMDEGEGTFQFFDQLIYQDDEAKGAFKFSYLPQGRFLISKEYSTQTESQHSAQNKSDSSTREFKPEYSALNRLEYAEAVRLEICPTIEPYCETLDEIRATTEAIRGWSSLHPNKEVLTEISKAESDLQKLEYNLKELRKKFPKETAKLDSLQLVYLDDEFVWKYPKTEYIHLKERNEKIITNLEEKFPGAITGQVGSLKKSPLYELLKLSLNGQPLSSNDVQEMFELNTQYPLLFKSWHDRHIDLRISLALINRNAEGDGRSEKACQFLLAQRTLAQILSVKGIKGTPKLVPSGHIQTLAKDFVTPIEYEDVLGVYPEVVDATYVRTLLGMSLDPATLPLLPRVEGASTSEGLIDYMRFLTALTSFRTENVWGDGPDELKPGRTQISKNFLGLGFSLLAVSLQTLKAQEIILPTRTSIELRSQNTNNNLAKLGRLAVEFVHGLDGLKNENDLGRKVLVPLLLQKFIGPAKENGALAMIHQLESVIALEGMKRIRKSEQESDALRDTIHVIGEHLENDYLKTF